MRLLLIEDEQRSRTHCPRAARGALRGRCGARRLSGWQMASSVPYDLIILDLMLPGISGTEVLKRLQQSGSTARQCWC